MAGSNAYAAPAAVLAAITTALATAGVGNTQIVADYAYDGQRNEREYVYGGKVTGPHDNIAMRAAASRRPRKEELSWQLYLRVARPDLTAAECAQRALAIGALIEEAVASAAVHSGAGVTGCTQIGISRFELENYADDDARYSEITYTVDIQSVIT